MRRFARKCGWKATRRKATVSRGIPRKMDTFLVLPTTRYEVHLKIFFLSSLLLLFNFSAFLSTIDHLPVGYPTGHQGKARALSQGHLPSSHRSGRGTFSSISQSLALIDSSIFPHQFLAFFLLHFSFFIQFFQSIYWFPIDRLIDWFIACLIDWFIGWLIDWFIGWLIDWFIGWLIDWCTFRSIDWLIDWFVTFENGF